MDKELLESLKAKSREERMEYFNAHKSELLDDSLEAVSGGRDLGDRNPNTESRGDDDGNGNYYTSWGWTCQGEVRC
jgi:hypothetical protein